MAVYHLTFQFKSNEHPWSGSHEARGIETDEAAIKWAQYFVDKIGGDYQITLYKNDAVLPLPEPPTWKWAKDMATDDIRAELGELTKHLDDLAADTEGHGGSPGEGLYERHDELTLELERR